MVSMRKMRTTGKGTRTSNQLYRGGQRSTQSKTRTVETERNERVATANSSGRNLRRNNANDQRESETQFGAERGGVGTKQAGGRAGPFSIPLKKRFQQSIVKEPTNGQCIPNSGCDVALGFPTIILFLVIIIILFLSLVVVEWYFLCSSYT